MTKLDELRKEYEDLTVTKSHARLELRKEFVKEHPSAWYRATHDVTDGKHNLGLWVLIIWTVCMAVAATMSVVAPNTFYQPGDQMYQLTSGDSYECPHCLAHSTTHYMVTYDGHYYYCPQCLNIMGHLDASAKH